MPLKLGGFQKPFNPFCLATADAPGPVIFGGPLSFLRDKKFYCRINALIALVAQLDRASACGAGGWGFKSLRAHRVKIFLNSLVAQVSLKCSSLFLRLV